MESRVSDIRHGKVEHPYPLTRIAFIVHPQQSVFCELPENATKYTNSYFGARKGTMEPFV